MDGEMILHVVLGLLLLVVPAVATYYCDKRLFRFSVIAFGLMFVQLLVMCLIVWALIKYDHAWLTLLWTLVISLLASAIVIRHTKVHPSDYFVPLFVGILAGSLLTGGYLLLAVLPVGEWLDPRWFVPVVALLVGHTTTSAIRGVSAYSSKLETDEQLYEFMRGNGRSHLQAVFPFVRRSLLAMLTPTMYHLYRMCIFTMPLLLCGILLGGMTPINAFVLMLMMVVGCVASSVIALGITLWLADRHLFDKFGKYKYSLDHTSDDKENNNDEEENLQKKPAADADGIGGGL